MTINATIDTLKTLPVINVYVEHPAKVKVPCVVVRDVEVDYAKSFGSIEITAQLVVLVSLNGGTTSAGRRLNDWLDWANLPAALEVLGFEPQTAGEKAIYTIGGSNYLGAELPASIEIEV